MVRRSHPLGWSGLNSDASEVGPHQRPLQVTQISSRTHSLQGEQCPRQTACGLTGSSDEK